MAQDPALERMLALMKSNPKAFKELMDKANKTTLVPHSEGQREVLTDETRFLILCAGRRWGKSKIGAARAVREARNSKKIIWWVAPDYKVVKRGYAEVVNQLPAELLVKPPPADTAFDSGRSVRLQFKNGSRMEFYSAERPQGMLGGSCDFLIMDEAATLNEHVWTQIIRPTLADRQGGALFISTPRGRNWFYYLWKKGQDDSEKDFKSWHFPSRTNKTIPPEEFDQMVSEMPQMDYEQEILAQFLSAGSSVFNFPTDDDGNIKALRPLTTPTGHVVLGIDLAKRSDFTVLCGVEADTRMPCYHDRFNQLSWPIQEERIKYAVDEIMQTASGITIFMDIGGPGDVVYDQLSMEGLDIVPINFTKWKDQAVKLLASDILKGQAFIHEDQLKEFEHYTANMLPSGKMRYEAARGNDDEVSAALLAHWGAVQEGVPTVRSISMQGGFDDHYGVDESRVVNTGLPDPKAPKRGGRMSGEPSIQELLRKGW
jgi:hypothetical protein